MDYMQEGHRLAVMPSLLENSPFTVMECLMGGLPFLTTRIGGVEEMIAPDDQGAPAKPYTLHSTPYP